MSRGRPGTTPGCGTWARSVAGCHCLACNRAAARYQNQRLLDAAAGRPRRVDATGTRRRMQALAAAGWPADVVGARMGVTGNRVRQLLHVTGVVLIATHESARRVFDQLELQPGPSDLTRRRAAAAGYAPPLAWDEDTIDDPSAAPQTHAPDVDADVDEIAVARAIAGDHTGTLTRAERAQVIAHLAARGYSDAEIAARCHVTDRTVERDRRAHNIPSTWKADAA